MPISKLHLPGFPLDTHHPLTKPLNSRLTNKLHFFFDSPAAIWFWSSICLLRVTIWSCFNLFIVLFGFKSLPSWDWIDRCLWSFPSLTPPLIFRLIQLPSWIPRLILIISVCRRMRFLSSWLSTPNALAWTMSRWYGLVFYNMIPIDASLKGSVYNHAWKSLTGNTTVVWDSFALISGNFHWCGI